jgi:hypothetical protein
LKILGFSSGYTLSFCETVIFGSASFAQMSDLKLNPRVKPSPYTGSAFDVTLTASIKERPGGHFPGPSVPVDVSAFSHSKRTGKTDPHEFVKKGTGLGGTVMVSHILDSFHPATSLLTTACITSNLIASALWKS